MAQEKEIKIKLKGLTLSEFEKRLRDRGFCLQKTVRQTDVYFDTKNWYLYNHIAALRLRQVDGKDHSFSFKKVFWLPKRKEKHYVEEIETRAPFCDTKVLKEIFERVGLTYDWQEFGSGEEIVKYLAKQGYYDEQRMPKTRKVFKNGRNEMVIDDVDQVGIVIELECEEDEPMELVKTVLDEVEWELTYEATGYAWLRAVKGMDKHTQNFARLMAEPDWNVWPHERKMYEEINI